MTRAAIVPSKSKKRVRHSSEQRYNLGDEDDESDYESRNGGDQNGCGGQIFDLFDPFVAFRANDVGEVLDRGIENFPCEHHSDGEHHRHPFNRRDAECEARHHHADGRKQVDARIVFFAEEDPQPVERVGETFQPLGEGELFLFHNYCFGGKTTKSFNAKFALARGENIHLSVQGATFRHSCFKYRQACQKPYDNGRKVLKDEQTVTFLKKFKILALLVS